MWASTSGGAAGSAATPTADDDVFINANFTVTLTADATCRVVSLTNGGLNMGSGSNTLTVLDAFTSSTSNARTINLRGGHLIVSRGQHDFMAMFELTGSNLTFIAGSSRITLKPTQSSSEIRMASYTFGDVQIDLGSDIPDSNTVNLQSSPTFRSLIIQSNNSAAHTVSLEGGFATLTAEKFIAIGSSSSNRLSLQDNTISAGGITVNDSFYAQNINNDVYFPDGSLVKTAQRYAGTNSIDSTGRLTLQDPPKISTLVDPLTTAPGSNPNWIVTTDGGSVTQLSDGLDGGGYGIKGTGIER